MERFRAVQNKQYAISGDDDREAMMRGRQRTNPTYVSRAIATGTSSTLLSQRPPRTTPQLCTSRIASDRVQTTRPSDSVQNERLPGTVRTAWRTDGRQVDARWRCVVRLANSVASRDLLVHCRAPAKCSMHWRIPTKPRHAGADCVCGNGRAAGWDTFTLGGLHIE
jgi:hypothetical protein